jgi:hypothetical protein
MTKETKKYFFDAYDMPALSEYVPTEYLKEEQEYIEMYNVVMLSDIEYEAHVATEATYYASIEWLRDKQEEYYKKLI